jgi:type VI secretion system protein ImpM
MPSMDRVGRYYPLAIAAALAPGWPLLALPISSGAAWFEQAERLALEALERDQLDLDRVQPTGGGAWRNRPHADLPAAGAGYWKRLVLSAAGSAGYTTGRQQYWPAICLRQGFAQPSLWWTDGSDRIARCLLICDGPATS